MTLSDAVGLIGGLIGGGDGRGHRLAGTLVVADGNTPSVTSVHPGQTMDISLTDSVAVADDGADVASQTRVLDARIRNDDCFGAGMSIALKTPLSLPCTSPVLRRHSM